MLRRRNARGGRHPAAAQLPQPRRRAWRWCDRIFEQPQVFGAEFMSLGAGAPGIQGQAPVSARWASRAGAGDRHPVARCAVRGRGGRGGAARGEVALRSSRRPGTGRATWWCCSAAWAARNVYAEALRAEGLPCVVAGGSIFNRAPEAGGLWFAARRPSRTRSGSTGAVRGALEPSCSPWPPMICWSCPRGWTRSAAFLAGRAFAPGLSPVSSARWRRGARSRRRLRRAQA